MSLKKSSTPKQTRPARRVRPIAGDASADCQEQFNSQISLRATVPQSPKFSASPSVATTFAAWSASTDKAQTSYREIIATESTLEQMYTSLAGHMLQYTINRDAFLVAVSGVCDSDEDAKTFGLRTRTSRRRVEAEAPSEVQAICGDVVGDLTVRWPSIKGAGAYIAEQCSGDPKLESSWSQCYTGTGPSFKMTGCTLGQQIWIRVRSIGKTPSAWSEPKAVIVR